MEASAAGLAASGEAAGDAGQQGSPPADGQQQQQQQNGEQTGQQFDPGQIAQTLDSLTQGQEELRQFLQSNPALQPPPADEGEQQQQPADLSFLEDPSITPEQAAERLGAMVDERAQAIVQQALNPIQGEVQDLRSQAGADALTAKYPELAKPDVAQAVVKEAEHRAEIMGHPELVSNFAFLETVYMAGRAAEMAKSQNQQNGGDGAAAATLEGAGGASPGGAEQGANPTGDQIAEGWTKRSKVLPFG